jgi:hypothetical protein
MKISIQFSLLFLLLVCLGEASLIQTRPADGVTTVVPGDGGCGGPSTRTFGQFTASADSNWCTGRSGLFGMAGNGTWNWSHLGDNTGQTTVTIDLGGLHRSVGAFLNYIPEAVGGVVGAVSPQIAVLDNNQQLLELYNIGQVAPISTPGQFNGGAFRGIERATEDIRYFQIRGSFLLIHDLTLVPSPVPEPGSALLVAAGLSAAVAIRRWRRIQ